MEDKTMIIVGVIVLAVVLFVLLIIPASRNNVLDTLGSDTINLENNSSPSEAPVPTVTELQGQDLRVGTGSAQVKAGDTIVVHYTGYFLDGSKFDSSYDRGEPLTVVVGTGQVIAGFERGVVGMQVGGQRRLIIPSDLAYGPQGSGSIPPNTPIAFDIDLIEIQVPPTPTEVSEEESEEDNIDTEENQNDDSNEEDNE